MMLRQGVMALTVNRVNELADLIPGKIVGSQPAVEDKVDLPLT